jgi:hypothetical protein
MQMSGSTKDSRIECLGGDGIPPGIQIFQALAPPMVVHKNGIHLRPEMRYPKPAEVAPDGSLVGILRIQLAVPEELLPHGSAKPSVRDHRDQIVNRFGMQVTGKTLKLRCQQYGVRSVDLLRRVSPPARSSS